MSAVDNYLLASPGRRLPDQLLLSGAGVGDQHLPAQLKQRLGMGVHHVDPFKHLTLAPGLEARSLMAQAPSLAIACGLAMREGDRCLD
ncbi:Competence protein A [compost metagenome]